MKQVNLQLVFVCIAVGKFPRVALQILVLLVTTLLVIVGYHLVWRRKEEEKEFYFCSTKFSLNTFFFRMYVFV